MATGENFKRSTGSNTWQILIVNTYAKFAVIPAEAGKRHVITQILSSGILEEEVIVYAGDTAFYHKNNTTFYPWKPIKPIYLDINEDLKYYSEGDAFTIIEGKTVER